MVMCNGSPIAPDGVGGSYANTDADDRAALWQSLGAAQGMLTGGAVTAVAGSLAVQVASFRAAIEERDSSSNGLNRGYHAWSDDDSTVVFDPPDAQSRNDALVLAVADTSAGAGAFGTGVSEAGPQLVVVKGVSGTTTPRLDSDIATWVGSGGWMRLADVPVAPGDTQINTANWTLADVSIGAGADAPPPADTWHNVAFKNGWSATGDPVQYTDLGNDLVALRGRVQPGTIGAVVFTLPAGYRRSRDILGGIIAYAHSGGFALVQPMANGDVTISFQSGSQLWVNLDGVVFSTR